AGAALVRGPVELGQRSVEAALIPRVAAPDRRADDVDDIRDGISDALATVSTLVAVAQLDCLVQAGRGSRGDAGPAEGAVLEADVHLDRRIAARIEDLPRRDPRDGRLHRARAAFDRTAFGRSWSTAIPGSSRP